MFKKKCSGCAKPIEKKFNFCPYCGTSFKAKKEKENYGMLGRLDSKNSLPQKEMKLPMGMDRMVNSLVKQLEKQLGNLDEMEPGKMPKGFSIRLSPGKPQQIRQVVQKAPIKKIEEKITTEEKIRRQKLPKENAESKVRRLGDKIIYEIKTPGIKNIKDVIITELATGIEIKAYSKNKCYTKTIPLKVELIGHYVKEEKVFIELKG